MDSRRAPGMILSTFDEFEECPEGTILENRQNIWRRERGYWWGSASLFHETSYQLPQTNLTIVRWGKEEN